MPEEPLWAEDDGAAEREQHTAAPALPGKRDSDARVGEFTIEADLSGPRVWVVKVRAGVRARWACQRALLLAGGRSAHAAHSRHVSPPARPAPRPLHPPARSHAPPAPPRTPPHAPPLQGAAIERFAQMTDWSYYEAARRFQRVLVASGIDGALRKQGVIDGDTVVIGDLEFEYDSDRSEAGMYEKWFQERRAAGIVGKGQARWPHVTG